MRSYFIKVILLILSTNLCFVLSLEKASFLCKWTSPSEFGLITKSHECCCHLRLEEAELEEGSSASHVAVPSLKYEGRYQICPRSLAARAGECFDDCSVERKGKSVAVLHHVEHRPQFLKWSILVQCPHSQRSRNASQLVHRQRSKRMASLPPPDPPSDLEVVSVTEDSAQLLWHPPASENLANLQQQINYRVEIRPANSPRKFSMITHETQISFEELLPNTFYEVAVYSYRPLDGETSKSAQQIHFTSKAEAYRLPKVMNLRAESSDFATLNVTWELPPHIERAQDAESSVSYYKILLYNLASSAVSGGGGGARQWVPYTVTGGPRVTSYTISNLQPDSFYKIRVFAVSAVGVNGHPATIASSPRIASRQPSAPPKKIVLSNVGALTATFLWSAPGEEDRHGEIVAYQLEFNSPEWLAPREITVADSLNFTISGLNPMTNYSLMVAAATRAGVGPKSLPLNFTTSLRRNQMDNDFSKAIDNPFDDASFGDTGVVTLPPLKVQNLRYVAGERNILLLWSMPPTAVSTHGVKNCVIHWGIIYPGPYRAEVNLDKRAFSIEPLTPSTTYMISVALVTAEGEGPKEMITAQTKPVSHDNNDSLIPLNVRVLSVGTDWAILAWDSPTCSTLEFVDGLAEGRPLTQRATPCASATPPLTYQLRYDLADTKASTLGSTGNCPEETQKSATEMNVNVTWVRLQHLKSGSHYVVCVRVVTSESTPSLSNRVGDWSFVQTFVTQADELPEEILKSTSEAPRPLGLVTASPAKGSINTSNSSLVDDQKSSNLIGNGGNPDIWMALAAIMVTTIVLMIIVIVVVCWARRSPIMVVGYKPDQQGTTDGLAEASVNLLSPTKRQNAGGGGGACSNGGRRSDNMTLRKIPTSQIIESQLVEFPPKDRTETWTGDSGDLMQIAVPSTRSAGVQHLRGGIQSTFDPMGGGGSDAASRGATGSSASSAVSLLPPVVVVGGGGGCGGGKPNPTFVSLSGNPLINPVSTVPAYGLYPSAQPQLGTYVQTYYQQHQQQHNQPHLVYPNVAVTAVATGPYMRGMTNLPPVPPPPAFPLTSLAGAMITPSNVGGPRIDLRAGENDGTYLQYPGLSINRGQISMNAPSDLISECSSGVLGATLSAPQTASTGLMNNRESAITVSDVGNALECSTVSSSSPSSSTRNRQTSSRCPQYLRKMDDSCCLSSRVADVVKAISTEELSQEMANLDGLMKDLSMITQNEFQCSQP